MRASPNGAKSIAEVRIESPMGKVGVATRYLECALQNGSQCRPDLQTNDGALWRWVAADGLGHLIYDRIRGCQLVDCYTKWREEPFALDVDAKGRDR